MPMAQTRRSTDYGTVILHALIIVSFAVLVGTGLRIATDDPDSEWLAMLDSLLPVEHLWFRHLAAGVMLAAVLAGYACYVRGARLQARVRLDRARLLAMLRPGKARWAAINVVAYWVLIGALATEILTGVAVLAGAGRQMLSIHRDATFVCLASVIAHVALHLATGGVGQLLRVARPGPLNVGPPPPNLAELLAEQLASQARQEPPPAAAEAVRKEGETHRAREPATLKAHPFATALAVALAVGALALGAEQATRESLHIVEIPSTLAPRLDGELSDPAWAEAKPVTVLTTQGGDFGGTHQSAIEIRAVHDGEYAYFAFVWEDPTRSLKHQPLVKRDGRWRIAATREDLADESKYNEDKLAVLLARPGLPLIGGAIHLARLPLPDKPSSSTGRGLHYTADGGVADVWQWRASHGGLAGHVDNCHFGTPTTPAAPERDPASQYSGGFARDPGEAPYLLNLVEVHGHGDETAILPRRLPRDNTAIANALGRISDGPGESESEGARWWMTLSQSVPYAPALDAQIPDGTVIPSVVLSDKIEITRSSIRGMARWAAGRWTLELARRLYTGSPHDVPIKTGVLMWLAAFDHAEKRHTRHLRPFRLEVD